MTYIRSTGPRTSATPRVPRGLPRGRSSLPAAAVATAQRDRIMAAIVTASAEHGYAAVTVADVVARARVSRTSFYALFADRDDCLLAAAAHGRRVMVDRIAAAVQAVPADADDLELLRAGLRAHLTYLRDEPAWAAVFYLELPVVGRRGLDLMADAQRKLAARTAVWHARARRRHEHWPEVRSEVFRALTGATEELVRDRVRAGETGQLPALEDVIVELHVKLLTR